MQAAKSPGPSKHVGVCDQRKPLANLQEKENFIDVVYDGIKEGSWRNMVAALRQFIEFDNHNALVTVKLVDQHRAVTELVGPSFDQRKLPDARIRRGPEELTLKSGGKKGTERLRGPRGSNKTRRSFRWSIRTGLRCVKRGMME